MEYSKSVISVIIQNTEMAERCSLKIISTLRTSKMSKSPLILVIKQKNETNVMFIVVVAFVVFALISSIAQIEAHMPT